MLIVRRVLCPFLALIFSTLLVPGVANARDTYFTPNCGSCHAVAAPTCNGCHVHGTHPDFVPSAVGTINLKATTDKSTYVEGDPIVVTLEGSNMADFKGWVGVRIYDAAGKEVTRKQAQLGCAPYPTQFGNKCDLPMKLSVPAALGWANLYASWAGNQFDRTGAAFGSLLGNTFGAGRRPLLDSTGNQVANHIEEIVGTGTFTVTPAPPKPTPEPAPTPPPEQGTSTDPAPNDTGDSGGTDTGSSSGGTATTPTATSKSTQGASGGAIDLWFMMIFLVAGIVFAVRYIAQRQDEAKSHSSSPTFRFFVR